MSQKEKEAFDGSRTLVQEQYGGVLYRNNSGALKDDNGTLVRFGLGNDSKAINDVMKSSDSIGGIPIVITQEMVGKTVLVMAAFEFKTQGWRMIPSDTRAKAQYNFMKELIDRGGVAGFVIDPEHVTYHVTEYLKNVKKV